MALVISRRQFCANIGYLCNELIFALVAPSVSTYFIALEKYEKEICCIIVWWAMLLLSIYGGYCGYNTYVDVNEGELLLEHSETLAVQEAVGCERTLGL